MIDQADRPNRLSGAVAFHWFGDAPPLALSIPEQIATSVGERIVSGCYPPSARITEQDLANEFHVSRGPIRDALRMLERERLVRILPRHGAKVAHLTSNDLHEVLEVSTALQRIGAVKLAETQPPAALQMLRQGVASLESLACDSQGAARFVEIAFELNIRSAHLSGNPRRAGGLRFLGFSNGSKNRKYILWWINRGHPRLPFIAPRIP